MALALRYLESVVYRYTMYWLEELTGFWKRLSSTAAPDWPALREPAPKYIVALRRMGFYKWRVAQALTKRLIIFFVGRALLLVVGVGVVVLENHSRLLVMEVGRVSWSCK